MTEYSDRRRRRAGPEAKLYTQLEHADSIRLLSIHFKDQKSPGQLQCSLTHARLSDAPAYKALSYAWKDGTATSSTEQKLPTIVCEGISVAVLANLHHAFFQLRELYGPDQHFWVDFLCINQADLAEKSTITSIVSHIYRSAEQVIVWLGPEVPGVPRAIDLLRTLAGLSPEEQIAYAQGKPLKSLTVESPLALMVKEAVLSSDAHWLALASFFRRSWFSRCWVAQEVLLAKDILVLCGSFQLTWTTMYQVSHYLIKNAQNIELMRESFFTDDDHVPEYDMPTRLAASRDPLAHPDTERPAPKDEVNPLLKHLIRSRRLKCSDPRDTIYSLLGAVPVRNVALPTPNYHLDPATVFHQTALCILKSSDDLLLLAHVEGKCFRKYTDLPGWVPDWSIRKGLGLGITGYKRFDACAGRERVAVLSQQDRVLTIEAAVFDRAAVVGESKHHVLKTGKCKEWLGIARKLKEKHGWSDGQVLEGMWRCLITDTAWSGEKDGKDHPANQALRGCFLNWMEEKAGGSQRDMPLDEENWIDGIDSLQKESTVSSSCPSGGERLSATAARYDTVFRFALHLKLFITQKGLLGLGTESIEEGDLIAIVSGSRVPLILRSRRDGSTGNEYELVGATYVHGCMHGEVCQRGDLDFQTVNLD